MADGARRSRLRAVGDLLLRALRDDPSPDQVPAALLPRRYRFYRWFVAVSVANFICFVVITFIIGGDAWNGSRRHDGHFLWGSKGFGPKTYHEVSRSLFLYSWWHGVRHCDVAAHDVVRLAPEAHEGRRPDRLEPKPPPMTPRMSRPRPFR